MEFSKLSIKLTKKLDKLTKKKQGIYFTPKSIRSKLINNMIIGKKILEPSCGSCEFINDIDTKYKNIDIDGVELNKDIYNEIINIKFKNNVNIYNEDFIYFNETQKYDTIIGNPPYGVVKNSNKEYKKLYNGRANIFCLFIIKSIRLIDKSGCIGLVIPESFLNSYYYEPLRDFINNNMKINIIKFDKNKFIDTKQNVFGLILFNKKADNHNFAITINDRTLLSYDIDNIKSLLNGSTTLKKLKFSVHTGTIVWNENKKLLSNNSIDTLLIYNSNIVNNKLEIDKIGKNKKQYIKTCKFEPFPFIIVNRGNGNSKYKMTYCLIDKIISEKCVVENHLNVIKNKDNDIEQYKKIIKSFEDKRTKMFVSIFLGNNGLSKTELENFIPIYE